MWKLSIDDDENNRTVVKLVEDEYTIGRAETNAIRLVDRNVSRAHARFVKNGKGWLIKDLNSFNGCFVNGERVKGQSKIRLGSLLEIGDYRIHLSLDTLSTELERVTPEAQSTWQPAHGSRQDLDRLVVIEGPGVGTQYPLGDGRFLIGRGEECAVSLAHASVSHAHAEIIGAAGSYELLDRASVGGLYVNGTRLVRTFLHSGDVIELGDSFLKFVPRGSFDRSVPLSEQATLLIPIDPKPVAQPAKRKIAYVGAIVVLGVLILIAVRGRSTHAHVEATKAPGANSTKLLLANETKDSLKPHGATTPPYPPAREDALTKPGAEPVSKLTNDTQSNNATLAPEKRAPKVSDNSTADRGNLERSTANEANAATKSESSAQGNSEIIRKSPF